MASEVQAVRLSNRCNVFQGILHCNTHCLHPHALGHDANQLRLNVNQAGLHVDVIGLKLEYLRYDGNEFGLNADAASSTVHQAWHNADEVGLDSNACTAFTDYEDAGKPVTVLRKLLIKLGVGQSENPNLASHVLPGSLPWACGGQAATRAIPEISH